MLAKCYLCWGFGLVLAILVEELQGRGRSNSQALRDSVAQSTNHPSPYLPRPSSLHGAAVQPVAPPAFDDHLQISIGSRLSFDHTELHHGFSKISTQHWDN
jgi:hypothetical protein